MIETDMRAHLNPNRMNSIARLARALAVRTARCCLSCGTPGFGLVDVARGLPCRECGAPTRQIRAEIHGCAACAKTVMRRERAGVLYPDQTWCQICNP